MTSHTIHTKRQLHLRRIRGATLIESLLAVGIIAVMMTTFVRMTNETMIKVRAKALADQIIDIRVAATEYIKANKTSLQSTAPSAPLVKVVSVGRTSATATIPSTSLQGMGFLPDSYINKNGFNQKYALLIQKNSSGGLNALITSYDGLTISDDLLGFITTFVGASGGHMLSNPLSGTSGYITGFQGGWQDKATNWGTTGVKPSKGHFMSTLAFTDEGLLTDYLYRNDIGIPEANRMNTSIDMNGHSLENVSKITGNTDLEVGNNLKVVLDVWSGQDVLASRDVHANRDVYANRHIVAKSNVVAEEHLKARLNLYVDGNSYLSGDVTAEQNLGVANTATIKTTKTEDLQADKMDMDSVVYSTGRGISAGDNIKLSDLLPRMVAQYSYQRLSTQTSTQRLVYKPQCGGDPSRARIFINRKQNSNRARYLNGLRYSRGTIIDDDSYVDVYDDVYAVSVDSNFWRVEFRGQEDMPGTAKAVIARTYCFYG
ncbi:shufflon system plasmid conjugative transfer pilus tip adhesin PilV [Flexibacterium corallicola]|uniref:shufflon system plasmid conjugative transfer pilus tip adhesin PilV n=1 Tax=Flexibacterium corallicola TaxID=3037259 RepID=UPI00286FA237|nr:shufflon system plasmid conjugative transfer pilus tip adhesin PilV [Pseudovibrio sp. M1P-2-3]